MRFTESLVGGFLAAAVFVLALSLAILAIDAQPYIPRCMEDAVLLGVGDFHGDTGRWDSYRCGPALDDFTQ